MVRPCFVSVIGSLEPNLRTYQLFLTDSDHPSGGPGEPVMVPASEDRSNFE